MVSKNDIQTNFGKELIEQLNIEYDELSSDKKIELKVKDILENLSVTYFGDKKDPDYDKRVTN